MLTRNNCCEPQDLVMNNTTGYLSITDGNSVYLGTIIRALGITTPVIDFRLNGFFLILTYTAADGSIQSKSVDLSAFVVGGTLATSNTTTINTTISGGAIFSDLNISAVPGNAITTEVDGIYVPIFAETPLVTTLSPSLTLYTSGVDGHTLSGLVNISSDAGNQLALHSDGLYIADATTYIIAGTNITISGSGTSGSPYIIAASGFVNTPLQVNDSSTIHFSTSGTDGHTLTGNVNVSAALNNALVTNPDGLYVSTPLISSYTDAQARAAISATSPLIYNNITGVMSISAATSLVNGYLTSSDWNLFNDKVGDGLNIGSGSAIPVYAGKSGNVLTFYGIRAGLNTTISLSGTDIVISSTGSGGGGPTTSGSFVIDFVCGDGGALTPAAGASAFNPISSPLIGKTVLSFSVEGIQIAAVPRSGGQVYYSFDSGTGVITLFNGLFADDTYYSIMYK